MQFIDLKTQLAHMRAAIDARIKKVLDHGHFIMGPEVFELEEKLAKYAGVKHCVSCANGTDALHISLMAMGIGKDDIVFTTAFSFFATAEVIPLVGATPYFCDINPSTYNLCPDRLESAIQAAIAKGHGTPKAVIAADMFGLPANYPAIQAVCDRYDLFLVADGAQGFGSSILGEKCGSFGDMATTSFFPAKPLGCYGDGGAIFTDSDHLAEIAKSIRLHGKGSHKYENVRIGLNSRLDTIQAAVLLEKLQHFDAELEARQRVAESYNEKLNENFTVPSTPEGYTSAWAQYTITSKTESREYWQQKLKQAEIPTGVYYPIPLNRQTSMTMHPSQTTNNTQALCQQVFSLPMHPYLQEEDIDNIAWELNR